MIPADPINVDRLLYLFRRLVRLQDPRQTFRGIYEFVVVNVASDGTTIDGTLMDATVPLPGITKIALRLPIMTATLTVGSRCLVTFINGDPTRGIVISGDPIPVKASLDASTEVDIGASAAIVNLAGGGPAVGRVGDTISISPAQFAAAVPVSSGNPVTISAPMLGKISAGSLKVNSG